MGSSSKMWFWGHGVAWSSIGALGASDPSSNLGGPTRQIPSVNSCHALHDTARLSVFQFTNTSGQTHSSKRMGYSSRISPWGCSVVWSSIQGWGSCDPSSNLGSPTLPFQNQHTRIIKNSKNII